MIIVKKILFLFILLFLFVMPVKAFTLPDGITASSVLVSNLDNDAILYTKDANKEIIPASITKLMTAYIIINNVSDLDREITIKDVDLYGLDGYAKLGMVTGETYTYRDLVYSMILLSAADSARTLANNYSGSENEFAKQMNKTAKKIGMNNTRFKDSYGGSDENISTAEDIYILLKECLKNETFTNIFNARSYTLTNGREIVNYTYKGLEGIGIDPNRLTGSKGGFTNSAGLLFVSTSVVDGYNYAVILCNSAVDGNHLNAILETYRVLDYIDNMNYKERTLFKRGEELKTVEVSDSTINNYIVTVEQDIKFMLTDDEYRELRYDKHITNLITKDNKVGDKIGYVDVYTGDKKIYTYDIYLRDQIFGFKNQSKLITLLIGLFVIGMVSILVVNLLSNIRRKF